MFRLSDFIAEIDTPTPIGPRRQPPGPVVVWNLTRRCNLTCLHCYSTSTDTHFPGELSTKEAFKVLDDLKAAHVPALILSGGEPLLRPDLFHIARRARSLGIYLALSTNGTLIDENNIATIADCRFDYVGISLDGIDSTHDRFRQRPGAFADALRGLRLCRAHDLKTGLRTTLTRQNAGDLPALLRLLDEEGIPRFYLSHLNYAGRGGKNKRDDAQHRLTRAAIERLFDTALDAHHQGRNKDFTTGNNDADGVYFLHWTRRRFPAAAGHIEAKLRQWGGNASGLNIANIDNLGQVHPDTMWWHHTLGNVRQRPFNDIWNDLSDPLLAGLKRHPRQLGGRCGACRHLDICNGNTRIRALQQSGDVWAEDPGCYLTDEEIGLLPVEETSLHE